MPRRLCAALAMSGWLRHLAATPAAWTSFQDERVSLRRPAGEGEHARTPWMVADLIAALRAFLGFAIQSDAVTVAEAGEICAACEESIREGASGQAAHARSQDAVVRFLDLIRGALDTGKAHLANTSDGTSAPTGEWYKDAENSVLAAPGAPTGPRARITSANVDKTHR